jgi:hypothetical protein
MVSYFQSKYEVNLPGLKGRVRGGVGQYSSKCMCAPRFGWCVRPGLDGACTPLWMGGQ